VKKLIRIYEHQPLPLLLLLVVLVVVVLL